MRNTSDMAVVIIVCLTIATELTLYPAPSPHTFCESRFLCRLTLNLLVPYPFAHVRDSLLSLRLMTIDMWSRLTLFRICSLLSAIRMKQKIRVE